MLFIREAQRNEERGGGIKKAKGMRAVIAAPTFLQNKIVFVLQHQFSNEDAHFTT